LLLCPLIAGAVRLQNKRYPVHKGLGRGRGGEGEGEREGEGKGREGERERGGEGGRGCYNSITRTMEISRILSHNYRMFIVHK
jgi:hypothetical protein